MKITARACRRARQDTFGHSATSIIHAGTENHKGDMMTKELDRSRFDHLKQVLRIVAVVLRGGASKTYDVCQGLACPVIKRFDSDEVDAMIAGQNCWVVDTGSGYHLVPKESMTEAESQSLEATSDPVRFTTANGIAKCTALASSPLGQLECTVNAQVLEKTPRVLSVCKLVNEQGARFVWDPHGASLEVNGRKFALPVKQGVPLLAMPVIKC